VIIIMGSVGFLLADWSIELIRSKKRKAKAESNKLKKHQKECSVQTEATKCISCGEKSNQISSKSETINKYESDRKHIKELLNCDEDIIVSIERMLGEATGVRSEIEQLKEKELKMAAGIGRQLAERDTAHSERVRSLEIVMAEKEKQMLQSSNLLRQQLAAAKREIQQLQRRLTHLDNDKHVLSSGTLEQEMDSMRIVLDMKREETEQLKAANNSLRLEMERFGGLDVKLQVEMQKTEEMSAVISMKNDQLRQVLDEYDSVQEQLEVEVSAHLACQQELEKNQWDRETFLLENEKRWKEINNQKMSGMVLDVVQKEKALAYSFNC